MAAAKHDINTAEGKAVLEQIEANIERAASLAEADNADALAELETENEALIVSLVGKDSIKAKKKARDDWRAAATVQEKPKGKDVKPKAEAAPTKTYHDYPGVDELINLAAEKVVEGVQQHVKANVTAEEIAQIGFDMWTIIPNSKQDPDIMGDSDDAKKASGAFKEAAGKALASTGMDAFEVERALERLWRNVQVKRSDVRAQRLRNLDNDNEQATKDRELFAGILKDKPEDARASQWVANHYEASLVGAGERDALDYHIKKHGGVIQADQLPERLKAIVEAAPEALETKASKAALETPEAKLTAAVDVLNSAVKKAEKVIGERDEISNASDDVRSAQRQRLEKIIESAKQMLKATI